MAIVTADLIPLRQNRSIVETLCIKRGKPPFLGCWAFPGGHRESGEPLPETAKRECLEETGVLVKSPQCVGAYGSEGRDPRGDYVSVCYWGWVDPTTEAEAADDAAEVKWFPVTDMPPMAFDHDQMLKDTLTLYPSILAA